MVAVGGEQLARGMGEVARQLLAAMGGVGADNDGAAQLGPAHPEDVLGDVVEEEGDMERSRSTQALEGGGPGGLGAHDGSMGPRAVLEEEADAVIRLTGADQ